MSSVSLRSHKRLKSAGGRLQTLAAEQEGERRARDDRKSRQVRSARETRQAHESSSEIFPQAEEGKKDSTWGRTQYDDDYGPKQPVTPVPVRPVSPTRRHNPHPAQPFMVWKHPVRIHSHKKAVQPPEEAWKYINEAFYDDYTDTHNTGDAKNEVPVTNLAKIHFPGSKRLRNGTTASTPHLMNGISGVKAQLHPWSPTHKSNPGPNPLRPPSPKARMIQSTVKGGTIPIFKEWLKSASPKERDLVLQMLTVAHNDSEETRLRKATEDVLQPDSALRVQQWLQSASDSEKKVLLEVLETLAIASGDSSLYFQPESQPMAWYSHPNHYRSYSYPVTLRPRASHSHHHHHNHSHTHHSSSGQYSRHRRLQNHTHSSHPGAHHAQAGGASTKAGDMALVGKRLGTKREKTPELWNHKIHPPERVPVIYPGSVFHEPKKDKGRHFTIHPEWPTA